MTRTRAIAALAAGFAALVSLGGAAPKKPVYVGARACGQCHDGAGMGDQYSKWLTTKHAKAYAVLSLPESREITKRSGLRGDAWKQPICLGCHSTASTAEDWEKDDAFRPEDGLQCESCHGPGSEYMSEEVMRNPAEAMKAGLRLPTEETCLGCHLEKGSHTAVNPNSTVDIKKAIPRIAHPLMRPSRLPAPQPPRNPDFVGSAACGTCHNGPQHGHQWDAWRRSDHARAWAVLSTADARRIAGEMKVAGDPQASPQCLGCHSVGADASEGVGCEACHGAGRKYATAAVMKDKAAAMAAGLRIPSPTACDHCHRETHGKPFTAAEGWKKIAHPTKLPPPPEETRYKTPLNLTFRPHSTELWVTCESGNVVSIVDTATRRKVAEIQVGDAPTDVAFTPDGRRAFVSNRESDTVTVIDAAARRVTSTLQAGDEPHGVLTDAEGKRLYVLNTSSNDIYVFDLATLKFVKTLSAGRGPWSLALSPDGRTIAVSSTFSNLTGFRKPLKSEITLIDTDRAVVSDRPMVPGTNLMAGIAWHPSGEFALVTMNRTKNLIPMTRLMQGWLITNGLAVLWADGTVDQVLLDQPGMGFSDATDVAITNDGRYALVTSSGTNRVAVVDCARLKQMLKSATKHERESVMPNHLGKASEFLAGFIATGTSPRGVTMAPGGRYAYVADSLDDTLTVIDLQTLRPAGAIGLDGPKVITLQRKGERLFHDAKITFRRQFACHSCHPDGHVDGITYDIEADGIGVSPVDNRTLRGIYDTAPFKWEGTNATLRRQCGPRLSVFFTRNLPLTPEELDALDYYITTVRRPPNRHHTPGEDYTPAQKRGKAIFERSRANDGSMIPPDNRCVTCHMPPYYTSRRKFDVGTQQALDRQGHFDVPHLNNIYDSAPYLHNGMADTLEEIWTVYNPYDKHGVTNDMTKDQLNDLIEFLKTL